MQIYFSVERVKVILQLELSPDPTRNNKMKNKSKCIHIVTGELFLKLILPAADSTGENKLKIKCHI